MSGEWFKAKRWITKLGLGTEEHWVSIVSWALENTSINTPIESI